MDQNKIITLMNPSSPFTEAYKKLQLNIQYASVDKKIQVIQITSTKAEEGKTSTALNLAAVYALKKKKVIVIDLDLRKPRVHKVFNLHNENGIIDILAGDIDLDKAVYHHESGIDVLVRGSKTPSVELTLESEKLATFINDLREIYDIIILDCPPTIAVTDSSLIARLADGVLFVVTCNQTKKEAVKESVKRLKSAGANIIGTVLTQVKDNMGKAYGAGNYSYYQYSEKGGNE